MDSTTLGDQLDLGHEGEINVWSDSIRRPYVEGGTKIGFTVVWKKHAG